MPTDKNLIATESADVETEHSILTGEPMDKDEVLKVLRARKEILSRRFGVVGLYLFGLAARNEMSDDGDIDILVRFDRPGTSKAYFGVQFYLEDLLGHPVDLVTEKALRTEFRPYVEREAINV